MSFVLIGKVLFFVIVMEVCMSFDEFVLRLLIGIMVLLLMFLGNINWSVVFFMNL